MRTLMKSLALAMLLATCTSTPMPIPPSLQTELVYISETGPTGDCAGPSCILIWGEAATEPGTRIFVHRLDATTLDYPLSASTTSDTAGSFDVVLGGAPAGTYRVVLNSDSGTSVFDIAPWDPTVAGSPMESYEVPPEIACLELVPGHVGFGSVPVGEVATEVVEISNGCDVPVDVLNVYFLLDPASTPDQFQILYRWTTIAPGEASDVVVVFWPTVAESHDAALVAEVMGLPGAELTVLSIPVSGSSGP